jgi:hypothetical protein
LRIHKKVTHRSFGGAKLRGELADKNGKRMPPDFPRVEEEFSSKSKNASGDLTLITTER